VAERLDTTCTFEHIQMEVTLHIAYKKMKENAIAYYSESIRT